MCRRTGHVENVQISPLGIKENGLGVSYPLSMLITVVGPLERGV